METGRENEGKGGGGSIYTWESPSLIRITFLICCALRPFHCSSSGRTCTLTVETEEEARWVDQ